MVMYKKIKILLIMILLLALLYVARNVKLNNAKLAQEYVEYGKYEDLRKSVPGDGEYDNVIEGVYINETNIIRRNNYYEISSVNPDNKRKVFVYSADTDNSYTFHNLTIETNKEKVTTNISCYSKYDNNRIYFADVTGDGKEELCLIVDNSGGPGIHVWNLHVFDLETLEEYKIENPVNYVENLIYFEETETGVHLKVEGKDYYATHEAIKKNYSSGGINALQNVGNYEKVYINENMVQATILRSYGVFDVFYKFEDDMFKISGYEITF